MTVQVYTVIRYTKESSHPSHALKMLCQHLPTPGPDVQSHGWQIGQKSGAKLVIFLLFWILLWFFVFVSHHNASRMLAIPMFEDIMTLSWQLQWRHPEVGCKAMLIGQSLQGVRAGWAVTTGYIVVETLCMTFNLCECIVVVRHTGEHHSLFIVVFT